MRALQVYRRNHVCESSRFQSPAASARALLVFFPPVAPFASRGEADCRWAAWRAYVFVCSLIELWIGRDGRLCPEARGRRLIGLARRRRLAESVGVLRVAVFDAARRGFIREKSRVGRWCQHLRAW